LSKDLVEGAPKTLKDSIAKADAEKFKQPYQVVGAVVELK
jgi:large subunit ribosomal protein L7/L12